MERPLRCRQATLASRKQERQEARWAQPMQSTAPMTWVDSDASSDLLGTPQMPQAKRQEATALYELFFTHGEEPKVVRLKIAELLSPHTIRVSTPFPTPFGVSQTPPMRVMYQYVV